MVEDKDEYFQSHLDFLTRYYSWLKENDIDLERFRKANDDEKGIVCNSFSRIDRRGWNITTRARKIMEEYKNGV